MTEALYHPDFGYYTANIKSVGGSRGDFATSTTLSAFLGRSIARWATDESAAHGRPLKDFTLIEIGAGDGSLMRDVLAGFSWRERRKPRALIVEISPLLRGQQRETLRKFGKRVQWRHSIGEALEAAEGRALIFSNELVDAFPVILIRDENEVFLEYDRGEGLREFFRPLAESRPGLPRDTFAVLQKEWPTGQRLELHDSYREWLLGWLPDFKTGSLLTIDYGGSPGDIYQKRPEGSLRAFFRHQRLTGPGVYRMFGKQDLTADVCFEDLESWGESRGLETVRRQTQAEFIREWAPPTGKERSRETEFLLANDGAGGAFKVLTQRAGGGGSY